MVIKFKAPGRNEETGSIEDTLADEDGNAGQVEPYVYDQGERFALPVRFDPADEDVPYSVLWSPFSSSNQIDQLITKDGPAFSKGLELVNLLRSPNPEAADLVLTHTYALLRQLHRNRYDPQTKKYILEKRSLYKEYEWYLRGVAKEREWGSRWREIWGEDDKTKDMYGEWANPFRVLSRIQALSPVELYCGAIHGDLHPRNIITKGSDPYLIDYGWAQDRVHIAKDFALMECNLRFVTLPPMVAVRDVVEMSRWTWLPADPPSLADPECLARCKLICTVRRQLVEVLPGPAEGENERLFWAKQYMIPMFLVALGLLRHLARYDNQMAARLTVLSLATCVAEVLPELEASLGREEGPA